MISSHQIKSLAAGLGFDVCGITRAERLWEAEERLKRWLREGRHGTMKYLEDFEIRAEKFRESFPDARSIIVVGVNYYSTPHPSASLGGDAASPSVGAGLVPARCSRAHTRCAPTFPWNAGAMTEGMASASSGAVPRNDNPIGRIARYAWGKDYHRVIGKRLEELVEKISEAAGHPIRSEICVDTKPLLERSLAQRAGLGFIGKQSHLLSPKFGPWLFLAELVTDLELEPDTPFVGSCGRCRICIDECPTQAILMEGEIDARRCIAYLTIEHKGEIAPDLQSLMGDWVFGCDICLKVCPYASKGKETAWSEFKPESGFGPELDLTELLRIPSNSAYEKRFRGTAITRASRKQLARSARIILSRL